MAFEPFSYVQTDIPQELSVQQYRRERQQQRPTPARRFLAVSVREVRRHGQPRIAHPGA